LPAPTVNAVVLVVTLGGTATTVSGTNIYLVGSIGAAVTSFSAGIYGGAVLLESDGTNWYLVAGLQDTGWQALSFTSGVTLHSPPYRAACGPRRAYMAHSRMRVEGRTSRRASLG
jgi:hypothetical protein